MIRRNMMKRSEIAEMVQPMLTTHIHLTPQIIVGALIFSFFVDIVSGLFPARKAAKLNPVEALRYE